MASWSRVLFLDLGVEAAGCRSEHLRRDSLDHVCLHEVEVLLGFEWLLDLVVVNL